MNKKSFVLLLMMLIASTSISSSMSSIFEDSKKKDVVLRNKNSWDSNSEKPRSLDSLIGTCYYENGNVYLNVPIELCSVTLTVNNLATGEAWNYRQESGFGWIVLPTSQSQGNYQVEVVTESSGEYIGYYDL